MMKSVYTGLLGVLLVLGLVQASKADILSAVVGPWGFTLESPTEDDDETYGMAHHRGHVTILKIAGGSGTTLTDGRRQIDSFFDIHTTVSLNGSATWWPVEGRVPARFTEEGPGTNTFDTEMLLMNLSGAPSQGQIMIRESPSKSSPGHMSIGGVEGEYHIDSFFDIFTELSVDGGQTWLGPDNGTSFRVHGAGAPVPEPGALTLLGAGALSLLAYAWRWRRYPNKSVSLNKGKNTMRASSFVGAVAALAVMAWAATPSYGDVIVPTDDLPVGYDVKAPRGESMWITDISTPGTTIEIGPTITKPGSSSEGLGGFLGGTTATGVGMTILMDMQGTGELAGFHRTLDVPIEFEQHNGPERTPGQPVQSFDTDMFRLQGQIIGDPDFDLLRITGGSAFGMPSPGHTTLIQLSGGGGGSGGWAVDSFFDITYEIEFTGRTGGQLEGRSGSTTGTIRMSAPEPGTLVLLGTGVLFLLASAWRRRRRRMA